MDLIIFHYSSGLVCIPNPGRTPFFPLSCSENLGSSLFNLVDVVGGVDGAGDGGMSAEGMVDPTGTAVVGICVEFEFFGIGAGPAKAFIFPSGIFPKSSFKLSAPTESPPIACEGSAFNSNDELF